MLLRHALRIGITKRARVIAALGLAFALLSAFLPRGVVSSGHHCSMPCCASGEMAGCESGACHVNSSEQDVARQPKLQPTTTPRGDDDDPLCGLSTSSLSQTLHQSLSPRARLKDTEQRARQTFESLAESASEKGQSAPHLSSQIVTRPCLQECGAGASANAQFRRSKESATVSHNARPRPPTSERSALLHGSLSYAPCIWQRPCVPRGPPHPSFV